MSDGTAAEEPRKGPTPDTYVPQSLFTEHMCQVMGQKQPNRWRYEDVDLFMREVFRQLASAMWSGYRVEILNFGVFRVVSTNAVRHGVPGKPGVVREFPPRCKVIFCPAKVLKRSVLKMDATKFPRGKTRAERGAKPSVRKRKDPT